MAKLQESSAKDRPNKGQGKRWVEDTPPPPRLRDTYFLLKTCALQRRQAYLEWDAFLQFVRSFVDRNSIRYPQLRVFAENPEEILAAQLRVLSEEGKCGLQYEEGVLKTVFFSRFYYETVQKTYAAMDEKPEIPFPSEESLKLTVPAEMIRALNTATDFVDALKTAKAPQEQLLRLVFPESIRNIIITADLLAGKLLAYSLYKIRLYLSSRNNASYVQHKLLPVLRGSEHGLRELVNAIVSRPSKAIQTLAEPTDFSFRFWAHLSNLVVQEFKQKKEILEEEMSFQQSAYLLGLYNTYYQGLRHKEDEKQTLIKNLESRIRKPPYAFTLKDIYSLRDGRGLPLVHRENRDTLVKFLQDKTKTELGRDLPEVMRLKAPQNKEYFIHRDLIIPLFVKQTYEAARLLKESYLEEWIDLLKQQERSLEMADDLEFAKNCEHRLEEQDPLLFALLNYGLLFLAREETKISYECARELERCFNERESRLEPLPVILGLNRKELLADAKLHLPLWQRISPLRALISLFKGLSWNLKRMLVQRPQQSAKRGASSRPAATGKMTLGTRREEAAANGATGKPPPSAQAQAPASATLEQRAAYRRAVIRLKTDLVGKDKTVNQTLDELMEKWNPLYDPQARENLVTDVNAMVRDYLRGLKRGFRIQPPDRARLQHLAENLSRNKAFNRITRKDLFIRYIEIYMVKLLEEK
jgi:hypothetical protein